MDLEEDEEGKKYDEETEMAEEDPDAEIEQHKRDLEKLKANDKEFADYLEKHGQDLLNFGEDQDDEMQTDTVVQPTKVLTAALLKRLTADADKVLQDLNI